jgi:hypothetical protein
MGRRLIAATPGKDYSRPSLWADPTSEMNFFIKGMC